MKTKSEIRNPKSEIRKLPQSATVGLPEQDDKPTRLSEFCIYTIRRSSDLNERFQEGGVGTFTEKKEWKSGKLLFEEARATGKKLAIIFAAGESISGLIFWGIITDLKVEAGQTTYSFCRLARIPGKPPLSRLKVPSTGSPLPDSFIRPYAICQTPDFLPTGNGTAR
jgi:hypothetical protein